MCKSDLQKTKEREKRNIGRWFRSYNGTYKAVFAAFVLLHGFARKTIVNYKYLAEMKAQINGIQQLGVGVEDLQEAWKWYRKHFSMDIRMFEDDATAELMLAHTAGKKRSKKAVLALNMQGGGGFEIWQHTGKKPEPIKFEIQLGDLGINIGKIKTENVQAVYDKFSASKLNLLTSISKDPAGNDHFFMKDIYGNMWEVKTRKVFFVKKRNR